MHPRYICMFLLALIVQVAAMSSAFAQNSEFYWNGKNYGRGVGTIPPGHCAKDEEDDGGLCYKTCRSGYHGVGPVCWASNGGSYGRGAGSVPYVKTEKKYPWKSEQYCHDGKKIQDGLCYEPCRDGYSGRGPVCYSTSGVSYGRGVGTVPKLACNAGMQNDAGLCYQACRDGYDGVGPVCWGKIPSGYVLCGAGFAKSITSCEMVMGMQIVTAGMFINALSGGEVANAAERAAKAAKASVAESKAGIAIGEAFAKLSKSLSGPAREVAEGGSFARFTEFAEKLFAGEFKNEIAAIMAAKNGGKLAYDISTNEGAYQLIRDAAALASVFAPSGVAELAGLLSAYWYPTYK